MEVKNYKKKENVVNVYIREDSEAQLFKANRDSTAPKGTIENPYTMGEFKSKMIEGSWCGGYVEGLEYVGPYDYVIDTDPATGLFILIPATHVSSSNSSVSGESSSSSSDSSSSSSSTSDMTTLTIREMDVAWYNVDFHITKWSNTTNMGVSIDVSFKGTAKIAYATLEFYANSKLKQSIIMNIPKISNSSSSYSKYNLGSHSFNKQNDDNAYFCLKYGEYDVSF